MRAVVRQSGAAPNDLVCGYLGNTAFVVTLDGDGHCEASLSRADRAPTPGEVMAFFRKWGVLPEFTKPALIYGGKGLHYVVAKGRRRDA